MGKRILVYAYFAKNVGDDLFLKVLFDRYPHVKWELLTANRNYRKVFKDYPQVKIIYSYREVKIGRKYYNLFFTLNDLFLKYKKYDAIVSIGGSIFMQNDGWKKKLSNRKHIVKNFRLRDKKAFILGANFGPFKDEKFIEKYRGFFNQYNDICFRDSYSYHMFKDLSNVRMASDVVYNLEVNKKSRLEQSVGISTINLQSRSELKKYNQYYNEKIVSLIESYSEAGYKVKLFSFCENEGDLKGINHIKNKVSEKYRCKIETISYTGNLNSFLKEFQRCKIIIGTRLHSLILAMLNNQYFYPLIYNEKTSNILSDLGIENIGCHIKDIKKMDVHKVISKAGVTKLNSNQVFLSADMQFQKLDKFIGRRSDAASEKEVIVRY